MTGQVRVKSILAIPTQFTIVPFCWRDGEEGRNEEGMRRKYTMDETDNRAVGAQVGCEQQVRMQAASSGR